jgi:hypothetical protein
MNLILSIFVMTMALSATAQTIQHHSCELWIPMWQPQSQGGAQSNVEFEKLLISKGYKPVFTNSGPTNNADHLLLSYFQEIDSMPHRLIKGRSELTLGIFDYASMHDLYNDSEAVKCRFTLLKNSDHPVVKYTQSCGDKLRARAVLLPVCEVKL